VLLLLLAPLRLSGILQLLLLFVRCYSHVPVLFLYIYSGSLAWMCGLAISLHCLYTHLMRFHLSIYISISLSIVQVFVLSGFPSLAGWWDWIVDVVVVVVALFVWWVVCGRLG
jgi:hypothetical protein